MACFHPLEGYRSHSGALTQSLSFARSPAKMRVPCGQCIGCRLERSRQWAIRCVHEASLYDDNCFITLTYNDEHLPVGGSLNVKHFQDFMKRLRFRFGPGIRFFHCGEYGEKFGRPHYHACLFNFDFPDKKLWRSTRGNRLYTSEALDELWSVAGSPIGFTTVGEVTFESAAYVARYITKKITGKAAASHYTSIDYSTGEILSEKKPEYTTMSRRPGVGKGWFEKFRSDVYPGDSVIIRGKTMKPPKYYDRLYELESPSDWAKLKFTRIEKAKSRTVDNTRERLAVRERIQLAKLKMLKRGYENDS